MGFSLVYLVNRFFYRVFEFLHHWYVHGLRRIANVFLAVFTRFDETIALRVTLRYFFHPLYKDYSFIGRILGIVFRSCRILIGLVVYAILAMVFLVAALFWTLIPLVLALYIIQGITSPNP